MRLAIHLLALAMALLLAPPSTYAQPPALDSEIPLDPDVRTGQFDNGLRYYIRANQEPEGRAELRLALNAGSMQEEDDQQGLAHFVEHMAFNGTANFEKQELVNYFQRIGMRFGPDLNAYTRFDETVYMLKVPTDSTAIVETSLQVLEDWARGVAFEGDEIDKERGVVIEEWRTRRGAGQRIQDQQYPVLLHESRYAERLPIGKKEILESFPHDAVTRFYRDWYRPDLMAVIAVGDFDPDYMEGLIRTHFESLPSNPDGPERKEWPVPDHDDRLVSIVTDEEATNSRVRVTFKLAPERRTTLADLRQSMVEGLHNAMLNRRLYELTQQSDPPFIGAGTGSGWLQRTKRSYTLSANARNGEIPRALEAVLVEHKRAQVHGFTATELEYQKKRSLRSLQKAYDERANVESRRYAQAYLNHFLEDSPAPGIEFRKEVTERFLPEITLEEINALSLDVDEPASSVILASGPDKDDVSMPSAEDLQAVFDKVAAAELEPYEDEVIDAPLMGQTPAAGTIVAREQWEELGVHVWQMSNGARVLLKPTDFKDDEVLFEAWSLGGTSLAKDRDYLSASMAANLISRGGVAEFRALDLQEKLADKAANVRPYISGLREGMSGGSSSKDVETLFQLTHLYFTEPRRDQATFDSFISRLGSLLEQRDANPTQAYSDTLQAILTQYHPRTRPLTTERLSDIDLDTALAFYRDRFADASDFTFLLVGSFELDQVEPLVTTYLASLPDRDREEMWVDIGVGNPIGVIERDVFGGMEEKARTNIVFTGPFEWNRHNRHSLNSMAEVLRIRLREVIREEMSGSYGVRVGASRRLYPRPEYSVSISFQADPKRLHELSDAVFEVLRDVQANGPTADEIAKVQETQRRAVQEGEQENGYWSSQIEFVLQNGIGWRNLLDSAEVIDSLTAGAVQAAAQRYLRMGNYVQVSLYPENARAGR